MSTIAQRAGLRMAPPRFCRGRSGNLAPPLYTADATRYRAIRKMPRTAKRPRSEEPPSPAPAPEVIVDFIFERGLLHVAVANLSALAAYNVVVKFDRPFHGLGGEREMSSLRLFKRIDFLAPHKRIEAFLDSSAAYFARREPTRLRASITYRDGTGRVHERKIQHDLSIYKDLAYLTPLAASASANCPGASTLAEIHVPVIGGVPHGSTERKTISRLQLPG
jgi:hypothetical protein